jgi:hypothetical protein
MHTKRAAPRLFRLLLPIDLVYRFSNVDIQGDLMLLLLLPSLILTLNRYGTFAKWRRALKLSAYRS